MSSPDDILDAIIAGSSSLSVSGGSVSSSPGGASSSPGGVARVSCAPPRRGGWYDRRYSEIVLCDWS